MASASGVDVNPEETVREVVAPAELFNVLFSTRVVSPKFKIKFSVAFAVAFAFTDFASVSIVCKLYPPEPSSRKACGIKSPAS